MKKIISCAVFIILALSINSCNTESIDPNLNSSENGGNNGGGNNNGGGGNNGNTTDNVLLKKEIVTDETGAVVTYFYTYDGNKLLKVTGSDGSLEEYSYNGNLIIQRLYNDNRGYSYQRDTFSYDAQGKLSGFISAVIFTDGTDASVNRNEYTYNSNGTITVKNYFGNEEAQTELQDTATVTITNGNLVSYSGDEYTEIATYDSKNSPTKNILCDAVLTLAYLEGGVNNELTNRFDDGHGVQTTTSTYTYNSNNYPTTCTLTISSGEHSSSQYFYE
jgi:hypothetical protein